jgi:hypothetical protein
MVINIIRPVCFGVTQATPADYRSVTVVDMIDFIVNPGRSREGRQP